VAAKGGSQFTRFEKELISEYQTRTTIQGKQPDSAGSGFLVLVVNQTPDK